LEATVNQQAYEAGKAAYQRADWLSAVAKLSQAKQPGEVGGSIDHLLGNAYMKLGQYESAASAYADALRDSAYGRKGALSCNRGRALLASGHTADAIGALSSAVQDSSYPTPYKAYLALGAAYEKSGDIRNAGIAYRNAAIDEGNPNPSGALRSLGSCFMRLGRPVDAIEAYRTGLDFTTPLESQNQIYCDLGLAYVASNRMSEAVDAFSHATSDGTYRLSPEAQLAAKRPSETDALLAAAGYGGTYDPLDPTGESGELIPSAEDTGFFSISEDDIVKQDAHERKARRKHRHTGLRVFIAFLVILILLVCAAGFAYYKGYGWPTQQSVIESLFDAQTDGGDLTRYVSGSVSDATLQSIESTVPSGASLAVTGTDQSMTSSTVYLTATLAEGGTQDFTVTLVRDGISWKVTDVSTAYVSQSSDSASNATSAASSTTEGTANISTSTGSSSSSK
jgi:Flp pilus assembly protein TadD